MKGLIKIAIILLLSATMFLSGCERRPLDCEYKNGTFVLVNINWGDVEVKPEHMKIVFYPTDNSAPIFRYIDPDGELIQIPQGNYHISLYNWRTNSDAQNVQFADNENYFNFRAYTDFVTLRTFSGQILSQPDQLYSWTSQDKIISIKETNKMIYSVDALPVQSSDTIIINTNPVSMVKPYSFFIPIDGLECLSGAEAIISGAGRSKLFHDKRIYSIAYDMSVSVSPVENGLKCYFYIFGFVPGEDHIFKLNLIQKNGTIINEVRNLTGDVNNGKIKDFTTPISITCIDGDGGFTDPGIEDWENIEQDIEM